MSGRTTELIMADAGTLSARARQAVHDGNWPRVARCAQQLRSAAPASAEGFFLSGLAARAMGHADAAALAFERALQLDKSRYDAAVELAALHLALGRHARSFALLEGCRPYLDNSPHYLELAAQTYAHLGLHAAAYELLSRANEVQPGIAQLQERLAVSCVHVGHEQQARELYTALLQRNDRHQRNHYRLANLHTATDDRHIKQMRALLNDSEREPQRNVFLYYALGKELEDLQRWDEAFAWYKKAGDAVSQISPYDVAADEAIIAAIIETFADSGPAQRNGLASSQPHATTPAPIFIVGLPRTGSTLTERILASHSMVQSLGETRFLQLAVQRAAGHNASPTPDARSIRAAASVKGAAVGDHYLDAVRFRLGRTPLFIDKLPENILYAGFIAHNFAHRHIVHVRRHPMDTCFALYKQSYFRFAYNLPTLARYYIAYDRLVRHWQDVLGTDFIELEYEDLVTDPATEIRNLLRRLGLEFEDACLAFHTNRTPSATPSAVQVRRAMHRQSVGKWRHFARHLEPLRAALAQAGIATD